MAVLAETSPVALSINGIEDIPGIRFVRNESGQGGVNCNFQNGWTVTLRGHSQDSQLLVFVSHNGNIRPIESLIRCSDMRISDEKRFLSREEILRLLNAVSCLDNSGRVPLRT